MRFTTQPTQPDFLAPGASPARLIQAAVENHDAWFAASARASGGEVRETGGVRWMVAEGKATLAFPRLSPESAGDTLDAIVAECFERRLESVSCWSQSPTRPSDLGGRLAARGFEWGWRPHWMSLALDGLSTAVPDGVQIAPDDALDWDVDDLPYHSRDAAETRRALMRDSPRRAWCFAARRDGKIVGQSAVFVTRGRLGVAGIYNVGVVPSARGQGIGSAVSLAACQFARTLGCHYALLNSAADALYTSLGFVSLGWGQTYWMHAPTLAAPPPSQAQIAFAEALGRGDTVALGTLSPAALPADLNAPLPGGATPMALAVQARKSTAVKWLVAQGATLGVLHAWDLGWRAHARRLLAASPEQVNRRSGPGQITLLHEAVWRKDLALVRLLLDFHPDLTVEDDQFHSVPLGWARHLQRTEIASLLESHPQSSAGSRAG